jgi:fructokinase
MKRRPTIVGLGEILCDVFPDGPRFGGAPANFACAAAELAGDRADVFMASAVGNDDLGRRAVAALTEHGVDTQYVAIPSHATGQVHVELDEQRHASYEFASDTAWDHLTWTADWFRLAQPADAVCFGTLAQRSAVSRQTIQGFIEATPGTCLRVLDLNLRAPHWTAEVVLESLNLANVLKLNDSELAILAEIVSLEGTDRELLEHLMETFSLSLVVLTRGANGAALLNHAGEFSDLPSSPCEIVDTVGAGDAFTAAVIVGLLDRLALAEIHRWAGRVAAFVCSQPGATPTFPPSIREPCQ